MIIEIRRNLLIYWLPGMDYSAPRRALRVALRGDQLGWRQVVEPVSFSVGGSNYGATRRFRRASQKEFEIGSPG
jgi:hypothetical protein